MNNKLVTIENNSSFKLDPLTGAYVNVDKGLLADRKYKKKMTSDIREMQIEINNLKYEVELLKKQLMDK
jgi:hypothetical protein